MKCYDDGEWQAYQDNEVNNIVRAEMDAHLAGCLGCRKINAEIRANAIFTDEHLSHYTRELVRASRITGRPEKLKGGVALLKKYKGVVAAAVIILGMGVSLSFEPVRALAQDFLTLFRVEKVETITINPQELQQMQQVFYNKMGKMKIDNFGQVANDGFGPGHSVASLQEAQQELDFPVVSPGYLPWKDAPNFIEVQPGGTVSFTLAVNKANALIKSLGGTALLPVKLDNQTFELTVSQSLRQTWINPANGERTGLKVIRMRSPEIKAPSGVNVNDLRKALLSLPVIPETVRQQLAAIEDWQSTLVIPAGTNREVQEIAINGNKGVYIDRGHRSSYGFVLWQQDGVITVVDGALERDELVKVAESLR